jgi:hypothetical protein
MGGCRHVEKGTHFGGAGGVSAIGGMRALPAVGTRLGAGSLLQEDSPGGGRCTAEFPDAPQHAHSLAGSIPQIQLPTPPQAILKAIPSIKALGAPEGR